jgi:phosphoribosyl-ATP pyrophosphohydrolase/phosphoribosyl-AMP cyclohydrolase
VTGKRISAPEIAWSSSGLIPAVVQDSSDGRVLMLAYVDAEALAATLDTGLVHFHSRSRDRLWCKGEESGHVLKIVDVAADCDGDALLLTVDPVGPTCHRNTRSCFDPAGAPALPDRSVAAQVSGTGQGFAWLETLWATIEQRAGADPASSYTARLIAAGVDMPARKVAEEATEVLMAAKDDAVATPDRRAKTRDDLTGEVADLLYHTLVLLRERNLAPSAVIARLRERHNP